MVAARNRLYFIVAVVTSLALTIGCSSKGSESTLMADNPSERVKANKLVASYGSRMGASGANLDVANDRSFGDLGFHYDQTRGVLTGRVFIMKLNSDLLTPELTAKAKTAMLELNSPRIVSLFERSGGHFAFDAKKDILFLEKDFSVVHTSSKQFREQMDELADVGAKWTFRWYKWAMEIIYGYVSPPNPPVPVTRLNDAQHTEFKR